jgi:hypothetical protein
MGAKERGRQRAEEIAGSPGTIGTLRARRDQSRSESAPPPAGDGQPAVPDKPQYAPSHKKPAPAPEGNVAGELLKKRKERPHQD